MQRTLSVRKMPYIPTLTILAYIFQYCCINNLILTFKYSVLTKTPIGMTSKMVHFTLFFSFFFDRPYAFKKNNLVRHKIKKCGLIRYQIPYAHIKGGKYDPENNYSYVEDIKVSVSIKKLMPTNKH